MGVITRWRQDTVTVASDTILLQLPETGRTPHMQSRPDKAPSRKLTLCCSCGCCRRHPRACCSPPPAPSTSWLDPAAAARIQPTCPTTALATAAPGGPQTQPGLQVGVRSVEKREGAKEGQKRQPKREGTVSAGVLQTTTAFLCCHNPNNTGHYCFRLDPRSERLTTSLSFLTDAAVRRA